MNFPLDLLEQADHLARRELKRPREASLRRSASAAYYALFHLLTGEAALLMTPNLGSTSQARFQRLFSHDSVRQTCIRFLQTPVTPSLLAMIGSAPSNELREVASAFLQLLDVRHSADYDLNSTWNRSRSIQHVQKAEDAFRFWGLIRKTAEANAFLLSFLLLKQIEGQK